jgi:hypothetical protein
MELSKRYLWKTISEDGLLKDPMNTWGDQVFNQWGYKTKEEAIAEFRRLIDIDQYKRELVGLGPPTCILIEEYSTFYN